MAEPRKQNYLHGAAILAASVVIIKILGAVYKIPLYNILGDAATTHFAVAYNIYSLLLTISTAGLPVALSRMIAEANTLGRPNQVKRIFVVSFRAFFVLGFVSSAVMLFFPRQLAILITGKDDAAYSIIALAPSLFFVCIMSAYRGYTQGHLNMKPTGISQIIEVVGKLAFGLTLAWIAIRYGLGKPMASAGAIAGVSIGSIVAAAYMFFARRKQVSSLPAGGYHDTPSSGKRILIKLLKIGIPIALGSCILNIINLVDNKLILSRLQEAAGFTYDESTVLYGVYFKVMTLFNLPSAFIVPMTISVIPAISAFRARNEHRSATLVVESSLKITTLFALPAGVGLSVLAFPITNVVYPGSAAEGPALLVYLGIASYFVCLYLITTAILQSYGYERIPLYILPVGGAVKIILNWLLVGEPDIGIMGAPIGTLACYLTMSVFNLIFILRKLPEKPKFGKVFLKPLFASAVMGALARAIYSLLDKLLMASSIFASSGRKEWLSMVLSMFAAIVFAVIVYAVLVIAMRAITKEDVKLLPKGEKIARFLKIK